MLRQIISVIVIIIPAIIFGWIGKTTEMGLMIVAGSITAAFLNINSIQRFKGAGFEAEMKKAVEEAYATIDNLKEMSIPLIVSTLNTVIYSGRWGGLGINQTHNIKDDIEFLVRKLEIKDEKVKETIEDFYRQHTWDVFQYFTSEYLKGKSNVNELSKKLNEICDRKYSIYPSKEDILKILGISESDLSEVEIEKLKDYLYYKQNRKLRRVMISDDI
jgi:hypothetical protein